MKLAIKVVVIAAIVVGAFFLLRTRILWLDYFDGTIVKKVEKDLVTVIDRHAQDIGTYYLEVVTEDARELTVQVDQLQYFRAKKGMRVNKEPFTSEVRLQN